MDSRVHVAEIQDLDRLQVVLASFGDTAADAIEAFGHESQRKLAEFEAYCDACARDLESRTDELDTSDDEEDDVDYLIYERDEADKRLQQALYHRARIEEAIQTFDRAARSTISIVGHELADGIVLLHTKAAQLDAYVNERPDETLLPDEMRRLFGAEADSVRVQPMDRSTIGIDEKFDSVWTFSSLIRGRIVEEFLLGRLANIPVSNFDVVDDFDEQKGVVTSIKSCDLTLSSYQNERYLRTLLDKHAKSLSEFNGWSKGGFTITADSISARVLAIAFTSDITPQQEKVLDEFVAEARAKYPNVEIAYRYVD
jgi:hypothetical protein